MKKYIAHTITNRGMQQNVREKETTHVKRLTDLFVQLLQYIYLYII